MSLTKQQQQLIVEIDRKTKVILNQDGDEEALLVEMLPLMPKIKALIDSAPKKAIEMYFYQYDGFYLYMKVLESLAQKIEQGALSLPL